jgi:hypothetical protein
MITLVCKKCKKTITRELMSDGSYIGRSCCDYEPMVEK